MHFVEILGALGPLGVLILAVLDSAGVPVVGGVDALMIWISVSNPGVAYSAAGCAVLGSVIGSLFLFFIARKGGEAYLHKYTSARALRFKAWFLEYGMLTVFVPAAIPIIPMPVKIFVLSAGALGINTWMFTAVLLLGRLMRYFAIAWLGLRLGSDTLPYLRQHVWQLSFMAVGLFAVLYLLIHLLDRRRKIVGGA